MERMLTEKSMQPENDFSRNLIHTHNPNHQTIRMEIDHNSSGVVHTHTRTLITERTKT